MCAVRASDTFALCSACVSHVDWECFDSECVCVCDPTGERTRALHTACIKFNELSFIGLSRAERCDDEDDNETVTNVHRVHLVR